MKKSPVWAWVKEYLFWIEKPYIYTVEIREKHFYFFFAYLFVTQFVHVNVHFKGFVYWMYEIILVYILDTWSSYVLAIYIYMHMLLEVSDMTTSEVWPFLFIFSIFQQKNATLPNLSFVAYFLPKKTGTRKHLATRRNHHWEWRRIQSFFGWSFSNFLE